MDDPICDVVAARRLARTIVSDIAIYHKEAVEQGIVEDNLFALLREQIEEGRELFHQRVDEGLLARGLYEKALVDLLLKPYGRIKSRIW